MDIVPVLRSISQRLDRTAAQACTSGADEITKLRAEVVRLRRLTEHSADMLEGAQSGYISGSGPDMEFDTHRDLMVKDLRAALVLQQTGERK